MASKYPCTSRDCFYKWMLKNPEKRKAQVELAKAVKLGEIVRPGECSACGIRGKVHGHHKDYSKPLKVIWLCVPCHRREHPKIKIKPPRKIGWMKRKGHKMSTAAAIALVLGRTP